MTPFDYVKSVSETKKDIADENFEKEYVPFVINKALSMFLDTILYASEMNENHTLSKDAQYKYYLGSLTKKKRFSKWPASKKDKADKDLLVVSKHYKCSLEKAEAFLKILKKEQIEKIYLLEENPVDLGKKTSGSDITA